jgi:hypothetical protein
VPKLSRGSRAARIRCPLRRLVAAPFLLAILLPALGNAQDLEPRRWSHLPVGVNFAAAAYAYTDGNIFLDPAVLVEDAQAEIHTLGLGYVHSFGLFGRSARIDFGVPFSNGHWAAVADGDPVETRRQGFGDPKLRFALNLVGSPAQTMAEFAQFTPRTIVGAALEVLPPLGQYYTDRLVNLGSNRWVFRPQLGVVHNTGPWSFEATGSVWVFGDNDDYQAPGRKLEQDALYTLQLHAIYTFKPGLWASLSAGYGYGGRAIINNAVQPDDQGNFLWAASFGFPIDRKQGIKMAFQRGTTTKNTGVDYHRFILAYSLMWGGR